MSIFTSCAQSIAEKLQLGLGASNHQFLILGPEEAGKTTLLYKLKIQSYKKTDIIRDMAAMKKKGEHGKVADPGFHFEEMRSATLGQYGMWEIPGNDAMRRMWPMFYRYIRISCVVFVVDAFSPGACSLKKDNLSKLVKARDSLHHLLNENELRQAIFLLVLNIKTTENENAKTTDQEDYEKAQKALCDMLGVPEIEMQKPHRDRFKKVVLDCSSVAPGDPQWEQALQEFSKMYLRIQARNE
eukprot:TRINITY_DN63495_c0_g1_i1.p1 TRINITY_DN63495_c0_g1~~TRINITY_DN63495_c0_g1_i1.p1  ORF type:complete len:255 (+),score=42.95 TRINITY_DN63495_c0_g1_i1:41-766(+)